MKNHLLAVGALALASVAAHASTIVGSDAIALFNVTANPSGTPLAPIAGINNFMFSGSLTSSTGKGDLGVIPAGTAVSGTNVLYPNGVNGGTGGTPFSLIIGTYGTFTETANPIVESNVNASGTASSVDLYLLGIFTPSGALSSFQAGPASFDVSFTESGVGAGASVSGSGTLTSPPAGVVAVTPEPSALVLLGTGLAGLAGVVRRRVNR